MAILIDGYNLLHATGYIAAGNEYTTLDGPRREFLSFLRDALTSNEAAATTVVFDAAKAPPGLPQEVRFGPIRVLFAHNHDEADDLIEELIRADNVPQSLTVVSSDHRLHRAARRRKAHVVDSDQWYWTIRERDLSPDQVAPDKNVKPETELNEQDVSEWLAVFGEVDIEKLKPANEEKATQINSQRHSDQPPTRSSPAKEEMRSNKTPQNKTPKSARQAYNPFPAGYAEDVKEIADDAEDIFPPGYGDDLLKGDDE